MAGTAVASPRNPLRTYQFRIALQPSGATRQYVAGVQRVSGLSSQIEAQETWEGGNNLHRYANPNRVAWNAITLEQGLALDDTLERWAAAVLEYTRTGRAPSEPVKRDVYIDVWEPYAHPAGPGSASPADPSARLRSFRVKNAWISRYDAMPQLDAMSSEVGLMTVELTHEGWTDHIP